MATTLFLTGGTGGTSEPAEHFWRPEKFTGIDGSTYYPGHTAALLRLSRGGVPTSVGRTSVAGPIGGIELTAAGSISCPEWISAPLDADVTISGTITLNLWAQESSMNANAAVNVRVEKIDAATGARTVVATSTRTVEVSTSAANNNFTVTPTSTAFSRGDRIAVRVIWDDSTSNMGSGFTITFHYNGSTGDRDSNIVFTENLSFAAVPTTTTLVFSDTAASGGINPGSATEKEIWTSGGSRATSTTTAVAGPTSGVQATATAGGSALEWYTRPLQAVTVGGMIRVRTSPYRTTINPGMGVVVEVAVVDNDGTNPTVIGVGGMTQGGGPFVSDTSENVVSSEAFVGIHEVSLTDGQRLRFRFYWDDPGQDAISGGTVVIPYNVSSAGTGGYCVAILGATLAEFVDVYVPRNPGVNYQDPGVFAVRRGTTRRLWLPNLRPPRPARPCITTSTRKEGHGGLHDHQRQRPAARERQRWRRRRRCVLVQGRRDAHRRRARGAAQRHVVRAAEHRSVREPDR